MKIINQTKGTVLSDHTVLADTIFARLKGLLGRSSLGDKEALVINKCNSIHMFFMRFSIDVVFVDNDFNVVGCVEEIKPFRVSPIFFKAQYAIEVPVGTIQKSKTVNGDHLKMD